MGELKFLRLGIAYAGAIAVPYLKTENPIKTFSRYPGTKIHLPALAS